MVLQENTKIFTNVPSFCCLLVKRKLLSLCVHLHLWMWNLWNEINYECFNRFCLISVRVRGLKAHPSKTTDIFFNVSSNKRTNIDPKDNKTMPKQFNIHRAESVFHIHVFFESFNNHVIERAKLIIWDMTLLVSRYQLGKNQTFSQSLCSTYLSTKKPHLELWCYLI